MKIINCVLAAGTGLCVALALTLPSKYTNSFFLVGILLTLNGIWDTMLDIRKQLDEKNK